MLNPANAGRASNLHSLTTAAMLRSSLPWLILGTVAVSAGLAWLTLTRGGAAGNPATPFEHYELPPFHEVEIGGVAHVLLEQGESNGIDAEAGGRARVEASVSNDRLVVWARDRRRWWKRLFGHQGAEPATITIRLRELDVLALTGNVKVTAPRLKADSLRIVASGGASLTIDDLRATSLRVDGSGALKAELAGRVDDQEISISGAGSYRAEGLRATDATVSVSGVANVIVNAERKLRASISGAGNIEYLGNPRVIEDVSGIGRVKRRDSSATSGWPIACDQCSGPADESPPLNSSGPPVAGSTSGWMPGRTRTSATRQSRSNPTSIAATSCTGSYG
jgi:hypothetical protein